MSTNEIRSQTLPFNCLMLREPDLQSIERILQEKTTEHKCFYYNTALIINIEAVEDIPDVAEIKKLTDKYNFILIGFSGVTKNDIKVRIFNAGYPVYNAIAAKDIVQIQNQANSNNIQNNQTIKTNTPPVQSTTAQTQQQVQLPSSEGIQTKVIKGNVRSGVEFFAKGTSAMVFGDVSNGSKVFADQDVIIMGALRGRAIAGAHGNTKASIFCLQFNPELISIGGVFKPCDNIDESLLNKPVRITLEDDKFKFDLIDNFN